MKNIGGFLEILSEGVPSLLFKNIYNLLPMFDCEAYQLRNSLMAILANVIASVLSTVVEDESMETRMQMRKTKDKFLDLLFRRILDKNSYSRSRFLALMLQMIP